MHVEGAKRLPVLGGDVAVHRRGERRVVRVGDGVELRGLDPALLKAPARRGLGQLPGRECNRRLPVLAAAEALLLGGGHDPPVHDQRGRRIVEHAVDAEDPAPQALTSSLSLDGPPGGPTTAGRPPTSRLWLAPGPAAGSRGASIFAFQRLATRIERHQTLERFKLQDAKSPSGGPRRRRLARGPAGGLRARRRGGGWTDYGR